MLYILVLIAVSVALGGVALLIDHLCSRPTIITQSNPQLQYAPVQSMHVPQNYGTSTVPDRVIYMRN